jgi:hypothetical protein
MIQIINIMTLFSYVKTATNKRLLISESHDDSNRCTPYRGNLTNTTRMLPTPVLIRPAYASCGGPHTWQPFVSHQQRWTYPTALEKKGSRHNPQPGWVIHRSATQFLSQHSHWCSNESQTSIDSRLLGLPGPYHQYAIGTFNTYSLGSTHRSLTDTGGGYNLAGVSFPTPLPNLPNLRSYTFHLFAPLGLRLSIINISL